MDSKVRMRAILTIVTAVILILFVVYAVNERQIKRMLSGRSGSASTAASASSTTPVVDKNGVYGEQIGDDLKAFLKDDSFFDGAVVGGDTQALTIAGGEIDPNDYAVRMSPKVVDNSIIISLIDEQGGLLSGEGFVVEMNDLHLYRDDDRDGVIYIENLTPGTYKLKLQPQEGFQTQEEPVTVEVN